MLAALVFPLQTDRPQTAGRLTVASEAGEFSIDVPGKLNYRAVRTRSGGGPGRVVVRGCQTDKGGYFFETLAYRPGMFAGTDDSQLDTERDELAREYGGEAAGEKKITLAGGSAGREFTIRGKPKGGTGIVTVRVREYVVGKALYAVMVTSPADGALPDDADRYLGSLKITSAAPAEATGTSASPRARRPMARSARTAATERAIAGWGVATDPDDDCKFEPEGTTLVI